MCATTTNVRCRKNTSSYSRLFKLISELLEDGVNKAGMNPTPRGYLRFCRKGNASLRSKIALDSAIVLRRISAHGHAALTIALVRATDAFGQQNREPTPSDTGSDLLWKKLEARVRGIADRFDGVMGVAILDLTDGRIFFA